MPAVEVTVTVVYTSQFRLRMWLAMRLIKVVGWLLNWQMSFDVMNGD
jgi:hypothetical protein